MPYMTSSRSRTGSQCNWHYGGKDLQKRKVFSREWNNEGVIDDESGELMEPMEEVPHKELGEFTQHVQLQTLYSKPYSHM